MFLKLFLPALQMQPPPQKCRWSAVSSPVPI